MQEGSVNDSKAQRRGRPRGFDVDTATAAAMRLLWLKGYEATTMDDLVSATGLSPSSLYAAFGSKAGVMDAALVRYDQDRDTLLAPLEHGTEGLADIRSFLDQVRVGLEAREVAGCLMVNTAAGPAAREEVIGGRARAYRRRLRDGLLAALIRAAGAGELSETRPEILGRRATLVEATLCGLQVAKRNDDAEGALEALAGILALLDDWAVR